MEEAHCIPLAGYLGVRKTLAVLVAKVWWLVMRHSASTFGPDFGTCQHVKNSTLVFPGFL